MTDARLWFLYNIDYYINFMLLLVGFLETFSAGRMYSLEKEIEAVGSLPVASFMLANFGSTGIGAGLGFGLKSWGAFFLAFIGRMFQNCVLNSYQLLVESPLFGVF